MAGGTPQTSAEARVIDLITSDVARGYKHPQAVGGHLFPDVEVGQRGGKVIEFNRDDFKQIDTTRTPGSRTKQMQFGYKGKSFSLVDHAIEDKVPVENREEAMVVPGIDKGARAVRGSSRIIRLEKEIEQATLAITAANYEANNKLTLAGKSQWSHADSNPTGDIDTAISAVRKASGMRPNTIVMGGAVFDKVKHHPKVLERTQYTSRDSATPDILAGLWNVSNVWIGDAVYETDNGTFKDVWGDNMVIAYTAIGTFDMEEPSYGYTYRLKGYPMVEMP